MFTEQINGLGPFPLWILGEKIVSEISHFPDSQKQLNIFYMSESVLDACGVIYLILTESFLAGNIISPLYK